ncbi:MAG: hypothetical protein RKR03_09195 [Candidatus Competibacter sp.]|nr:hypothetical protein [Candidatus Competibacter sp.]
MNITSSAIPFTDTLEVGDVMTVTPDAAGVALVRITYANGAVTQHSVSAATRFGPYPHDVGFQVTCLTGSCNVVQSAIASPLWVEGWDDLRFPAQGINPAGAVDAPSVDTTLTDYPGTLLFAGNADNVIAGIAQMPHAWKAGSAVKPHIHWSKPVGSASAADWVLYYRILGSPGDAHGALVGPVAGTLVAGTATVANSMLLTSFGSIDLTGQKESTCLAWQIRRLGNTDADNGTARLFEFDIHYQCGKSGTVDEFPT